MRNGNRQVFSGPAFIASRVGRELLEAGINNIVDHGDVRSTVSRVEVLGGDAARAADVVKRWWLASDPKMSERAQNIPDE